MIKIHCNALKNLVNNYICDRNVFYILLVPGLFGFFFPFYWLVLLPIIWSEYRRWNKPFYWIIGYWGFAALVWLIFLIVAFFRVQSRSETTEEESNQEYKKTTRRNTSASTEDLWSEDTYYPDIQSPDYLVSVNMIQPDRVIAEPKFTMDETWDYNYENKSDDSISYSAMNNFSCRPSQPANIRTSLLGVGNQFTVEQKKAYKSLGYTYCPNNSSSSSSSYGSSQSSTNNNNVYLQHQRLNRKLTRNSTESNGDRPQQRRCVSTSPYGKRNQKHLNPPPERSRSPNLPKQGSPHRGSPLNHAINPRHLRPVRDLSKPIVRSMERKKSPLVGNENRSPTPTVIRIPPQLNKPYMTPKIGLSKYHNNDNNNKNNNIASPDSKSLEKALAQEEKKPFNSYLKERAS
ncbi:uncharacterized protein [Lepeophtheirus salmonis]|uniref:uncharacterized protein n=1 Tax=Lepeophtheirus salmonis TaxID=72036 RepID=UPI003AF3D5C1